jgi:drug/metabolite transporter (DMT)-like permease
MSSLSTSVPQMSTDTFQARTWGLIALVILGWSTSWIALHYQVGTVAPEVSLVWRFALAGVLMLGLCLVRGEHLRGYNVGDHLHFAVLGLTLFSFNFYCFYTAGTQLVSGVLSVVFALAAPGNMIVQAVVMRQRVSARVVAGSMCGFCGLMALFAPEIGIEGLKGASISALLMALAGVVIFCTGNYTSMRINRRGLPLMPAIAWGMGYGAAASGLYAFSRGQAFIIEPSLAYIGGLIWLAIVSSVIAFLAYLSLLRGIGPARTGYLTVLFPVFALLISTFAEDYTWTLWSLAGLVCVGLGNALVLRSQPA